MILLDTHIAVWLALEPERLSRPARKAIEESVQDGLAISAQSLFEIAWLVIRNRIAPLEPLESFIGSLAARFTVYQLTAEIAVAASQLPAAFPSDPTDRIITATAIVHRVPLLTADRAIRRSRALRTLW